MGKIRFRETVVRSMQWIAQYDYQLMSDTDSVIFYRDISKGVTCEIEFQLLQNYIAPIRSMDVILRRKRLPNFVRRTSDFAPLVMSFRFLMKSQYKQDIIPDNKLWDFKNESDLSQQLTGIQEPLKEYAIKWIENPQSKM